MTQSGFAHVGDPHSQETDASASISVESFLLVNIIILFLSLCLVLLVNRYQQNAKYISPKIMIIIILSTLIINAFVAVNTYVEVK